MQGVRFEPSIALLYVDFFSAAPSIKRRGWDSHPRPRPSGYELDELPTALANHWFCLSSFDFETLNCPPIQLDGGQAPAMPNKNRSLQPPAEKANGVGWLVNDQQQLVCQFRPDAPSAHGKWVAVRTYRWVPPHPPVPQTRRRMLRHNAIEAWQIMLKTGWRRCAPPLR